MSESVQEHTEEECERVKSIFYFIKEMAALKPTSILNIEKQPWKKYVSQIPQDEEYIHFSYRDTVEKVPEDAEIDDWILRVQKPVLTPCPPPSKILQPWLMPGWDRFEEDARFYRERPCPMRMEAEAREATEEDGKERFQDSAERIKAYQTWIQARKDWADHQKHLNEIREFFIELHQKAKELERDSEIKELMIGNGILTDKQNPDIQHPILLQRVCMTFDAKKNEIAIRDTEAAPELYTTVLSALENVSHSAVSDMQGTLESGSYHPLDRGEGYKFLQVSIQQLSPKSMFLLEGEAVPANSKESLFVQARPVFFIRKRADGIAKFVDGVIEHIDYTGYAPSPLWAIAGLHKKRLIEDTPERTTEEKLAELGGEDSGILLSLPANREQLSIAQQIEQYDSVIVQGPPGTGKTHTIANLMGHFLAQGKRILVTSHTKKALSVLREKMPQKLQSLCVSLLDDSNRDMERSIDGISSYMSQYNSKDMARRRDGSQKSRAEIIQQLAEVRKKIYQIECKEHETLVYDGEGISPVDVGRYVCEHREKYAGIIPGAVVAGNPFPLSAEELSSLYRSNALLSTDDEHELSLDVPNPRELLSPEELEALRTKKQELGEELGNLTDQLHMDDKMEEDSLLLTDQKRSFRLTHVDDMAIDALRQYTDSMEDLKEWHFYAVVEGHRGEGFRRKWEILCKSIEETVSCAGQLVDVLFGKDVVIAEDADYTELRGVLMKMEECYRADGKIGWFKRLRDKSYDRAEDWVTINGAKISSAEDCRLVVNMLSLREKREACGRYWDDLLAAHGVESFWQLDPKEPERVAQGAVASIRRYLDWYDKEYALLVNLMEKARLPIDQIFPSEELTRDVDHIREVLEGIHDCLPLICDALACYGKYCEVVDSLLAAEEKMNALRGNHSVLVSDLVRAFHGQGTKSYAETYREIAALHEKYAVREMREGILQKLYASAPGWSDAVRARVGIHGKSEPPENVKDAWRWKQYDVMLKDLTKVSLDELRQKNVALSQQYRLETKRVAVYSAWNHMLRRLESDRSIQQNLQQWKLAVKKIGKGTGKRAAIHRAEARKLMSQCQEAVPAWIMTIRTALQQLNPKEHQFDVVIIDEASQADLTAITMLYLGKKIIIVGDDKQVSPLAVGKNLDAIGKLIDMHLKGRIPAAQNYTGTTSLYDVGMTICDPLMLREHFRCVPDIIRFSNQLCYDGKIKPLRDAADSDLHPALVRCQVDGRRDDRKKVNRGEAEYTVALIRAMVEVPEYQDKTFGVISLLGNEQAELVQELLMRSSIDFERYHILCGDAAQFQGDERDVILLNMVASIETEGVLRLMRDEKTIQRYNVAVSRARDQLWVLHSFPMSAVQGEDIRSALLRYVDDPQAVDHAMPKIRQNADSPFEEAVAISLVEHGYDIAQQWAVGNYRIDIVVRDGDERIALECDGDRYHSGPDKVYEDMERQMILERLGWRFIRLRGSVYYRDPQGAMKWVRKELEEHHIHPTSVNCETHTSDVLVDEVRRRAAELLATEKAL